MSFSFTTSEKEMFIYYRNCTTKNNVEKNHTVLKPINKWALQYLFYLFLKSIFTDYNFKRCRKNNVENIV